MFSINDLINIIEYAIGSSNNFFIESTKPKNPYNNEIITDVMLYNIYYKMKSSPRLISILFHNYFISNFNLHTFNIHNRPLLTDFSIIKYNKNACDNELYETIKIMINDNIYTKDLEIHTNFPKHIIVRIFRPYLYIYLIINYSISHRDRVYYYKDMLERKLHMFYCINPDFGKKYVKIINPPDDYIVSFNAIHYSFYSILNHHWFVPKQQNGKIKIINDIECVRENEQSIFIHNVIGVWGHYTDDSDVWGHKSWVFPDYISYNNEESSNNTDTNNISEYYAGLGSSYNDISYTYADEDYEQFDVYDNHIPYMYVGENYTNAGPTYNDAIMSTETSYECEEPTNNDTNTDTNSDTNTDTNSDTNTDTKIDEMLIMETANYYTNDTDADSDADSDADHVS